MVLAISIAACSAACLGRSPSQAADAQLPARGCPQYRASAPLARQAERHRHRWQCCRARAADADRPRPGGEQEGEDRHPAPATGYRPGDLTPVLITCSTPRDHKPDQPRRGSSSRSLVAPGGESRSTPEKDGIRPCCLSSILSGYVIAV
jgi:hypothetical protein